MASFTQEERKSPHDLKCLDPKDGANYIDGVDLVYRTKGTEI